jgi:bifunctional UDP-N-acetylglucosamine pyrophosphorylase / glucosamine-1-phosphate N-acetyltransferase
MRSRALSAARVRAREEAMTEVACIVLAAGLGTRMKSDRAKVLHGAAGRSLLGHVLAAATGLCPRRIVVVVGPGMDEVGREARAAVPEAVIAVQQERRGTADAVVAARDEAGKAAPTTLVLYGDVPLVRPETLERLVAAVDGGAKLAVLGFEADDPTGYGRLILDRAGRLGAIREELDATPEERAVTLCNSGLMAVDTGLLWRLLPGIGEDNAKGERYLTDLAGLAAAEGNAAAVVRCPQTEVLGVNSRRDLAEVERRFQQRLREAAMAGGATLVAPETVFLSHDTQIGRDVTIEPNVTIGPGVRIADGASIRSFSYLEAADVGAGAIIGPFARLRPGAVIGEAARIGNFVEVKNARVAARAKANHLAYLGDAEIGAGANIGAGTIICNYDGIAKHRTEIGANAFIGSNSALVAPVRIGEGAYVGSGSVITRDVPPDALALGRGRQEVKEGWAARQRAIASRRKQDK